MKTTFYLFAFLFSLQFNLSAQVNSYQLDSFESKEIIPKKDCDKLRPVYFNYSKRRLFTNNKMPLNGRHFLELCRGIDDPRIRHQIRKYDQLTSNKKKLIGAMIAAGVAGYFGLIASTGMINSSGPDAYIVMGVSAASLVIVTPILAISTSIPHQKRKEILFRDLPEAYNFYVLSQPNP